MTQRIRFTSTKIKDLPLPAAGARSTHYDTEIPKLAIRITAAGSKTFYIVKRNGAAMAWVKLGAFPDMTVEQARNQAEIIMGDFARGLNPAQKKRSEKKKQTLGDAYQQYRILHVAPRGIKTADEIRLMWERFLGPLPDAPAKKHGRKRAKHRAGVDWSRRKLEAIDGPAVKSLHAAIGRSHPVMANRVIELLSAIYNNARGHGYPGDNPASGVEPFAENPRERFIGEQDPDELPRFFKALAADTSEDFKHFVMLSLLTGARRANVLGMRWQDINLQAATWAIPGASMKNNKPQLVALVPEAVEILAKRKPQKDGFVFPAPSKAGYMTPPKKRWRALLKRAEVKDLRIHDLRRSLGSWQAITGASLVIIGKSLGHKAPSSTMIYSRLNLDPVRASVATATSAMLEAAGVKKRAKVAKLQRRARA